MGINYSCPGPLRQIDFNFSVRPEFSSTSGKDFYIEFFWNIENACAEERQYLTSLILPLYVQSTSKENINFFLNYYINNSKMINKHIFIARDLKTNQIEGMTINIITKEYYLDNDYSKENEYMILSQMSAVNFNARNRGIYREITYLEIYFFNASNLGKNLLFFDASISPLVYQKISKHALLYPNSMVETPPTIKNFMRKLMKIFEYESIGEENEFLVYDETIVESNDNEKWMNNYQNLSRETKYFIDQTRLRDGIGLLYFTCGRLIERNTLGLPAFEIELEGETLPKVYVKEHYFSRPKI